MATTTSYSRLLSARRPGTCPACGEAIEVGDQITRGESVRGYVHVACAGQPGVDGPEAGDVAVTQPGVYETDEGIFIVKPNRAKDRLYAKRIVEIGGMRLTEAGTFVAVDFEYAPGAVYRIRPEDRMPFDRARELTIRYGRCICCGRFLKAAESVEQGIGPVCVKLFPELEAERGAIKSRARAEAKVAGTPPIAGASPEADETPSLTDLAARIERREVEPVDEALQQMRAEANAENFRAIAADHVRSTEAALREEHSHEVAKAASRVEGADPDRTYAALRERWDEADSADAADARELIALALREVVQERDVPPADAERALRTFDRLVEGYER